MIEYGQALEAWLRRTQEIRAAARDNPERLDDVIEHTTAELGTALEKLRVADDEMRGQNERLLAAEEALEAERRRYQELFDSAPDGYLVTNRAGLILTGNQAAAHMLNIGQLQLRGRLLFGFIYEADRREFLSGLARLRLSGRAEDWELRVQPHGRPPYHASLTASATRAAPDDEGSLRWLIRNVHRSKEAEQAAAARAEHLAVLHEIDRLILAGGDPAQIAQRAAAGIARLAGCDRVEVVLFDEEQMQAVWLAVHPAESAGAAGRRLLPLSLYQASGDPSLQPYQSSKDLTRIANTSYTQGELAELGTRFVLSAPLRVGEQVLGELVLSRRPGPSFGDESAAIARQVADSLAVALQNARLLEELQAGRAELLNLARRLLAMQENERRAVVRHLHDDTNQVLASLILGLGQLARLSEDLPQVQEQVAELHAQADGVISGLHNLAVNLRPASLDRIGLVPALRQYVEVFQQESSLPVTFVPVGLDGQRLPADVETGVFRIAQEALRNVARHAHASQASLILQTRPPESSGHPSAPYQTGLDQRERLLAIIEDDGVGFDAAAVADNSPAGLIDMRERADMLGGRLTIESSPGAGTTIFVEIPL